MAKQQIKKGSFADQLSERLVPYLEQATTSVSDKAKQQMDEYFSSVKQIGMSADEFRDYLTQLESKLKPDTDVINDASKLIIDKINQLSDDISDFTKEFKDLLDRVDNQNNDNSNNEAIKDAVLGEPGKEKVIEPGKVSVLYEVRSLRDQIFNVPVEEDDDDSDEEVVTATATLLKKKDDADLKRFSNLEGAIKDSNPKDLFDKIGQFIAIGLMLFAAWPKVKENILKLKDSLIEYLEEKFPELTQTMRKGFENMRKWGELVGKIWDKITVVLDPIWNTLVEIHDWIRPKSKGAESRRNERVTERAMEWARENDTRTPEEREKDNAVISAGLEEGIPIGDLLRAEKQDVDLSQPIAAQLQTTFNPVKVEPVLDPIQRPGGTIYNEDGSTKSPSDFNPAEFFSSPQPSKRNQPTSIGVTTNTVKINNYMLQSQSPTD